jgi:hypothetical protein
MSRAVLKLTYFPGAPDLLLPEYSELQARLQKRAQPVMMLPSASGPAGY